MDNYRFIQGFCCHNGRSISRLYVVELKPFTRGFLGP